jgi:hypothetical protein
VQGEKIDGAGGREEGGITLETGGHLTEGLPLSHSEHNPSESPSSEHNPSDRVTHLSPPGGFFRHRHVGGVT